MRLIAIAFGILSIGSALLPTGAAGYLYWCNLHAIARATVTGREMDPRFIGLTNESPDTLAVSGRYVYFGRADGTIRRARVDGTGRPSSLFRIPQPATGTTVDEAGSLVVAAGHLFWSDDGFTIGRATERGTHVEPGYITTTERSRFVTVSGNYIYWSTASAIGRARIDGTEVDQSFIHVRKLPLSATEDAERMVAAAGEIPVRIGGVWSIAAGEGHLFWENKSREAIGRIRADGRFVEPAFIPRAGVLSGLAIGANHLYWRTEPAPHSPEAWIASATVTGSQIHRTLINVSNKIILGDLAVDSREPPPRPSRPLHGRRPPARTP
jgi:hypothetical protein